MTDLGALLDDVASFIRRFVVFGSDAQGIAVALWAAHSHVFESADSTPYLHVSSPVKRAGKTRLYDVLDLVVARPWRAVTPTEAVVFRKIAADRPTLLLDEVDALWGKEAGQYEGLRALLNAGHRRGVTVPRCVGEGAKLKVVDFDVFCPKAVAGIGSLPDTVADRSIPIRLRRRAPGEVIERFRYREVRAEGAAIAEELGAWAMTATDGLRLARPDIPAGLNDRAADGWEPLLAIADLAGGDWPARARAAALALHAEAEAADDSLGPLLLAHLAELFDGRDRMTTAEILAGLIDRDDGPWPAWWESDVEAGRTRGPGRRLARLLRPFGVEPKKLRLADGTTAQGYAAADLGDSWNRYGPPVPVVPSFKTEQRNTAGQRPDSLFEPESGDGTKTASEQGCSVVPFSEPEIPEQGVAGAFESDGWGVPADLLTVIRGAIAEGRTSEEIAGVLNAAGLAHPNGGGGWMALDIESLR